MVFVCGVPLTPEGREKSKGYVSVRKDGGWTVTKGDTHYVMTCPDCRTVVCRRSRTP